jgi:hypothetical protein
VQALVKIQGGDWEWQDWTDRPFVFFARDTRAESIEELVLVFTNSNTQSAIAPGDLPPTIFFSNIGSWKYTGTYQAGGSGGAETAEFTFVGRTALSITDFLSFSAFVPATFALTKMEIKTAWQSDWNDGCYDNTWQFEPRPEGLVLGLLQIGFPIYSGPVSRQFWCDDLSSNYQDEWTWVKIDADCDGDATGNSGWSPMNSGASIGHDYESPGRCYIETDGSIRYTYTVVDEYGDSGTESLTLTPEREP